MDSMKEKLIEILEMFNFPVLQQGSLNKGEPYPESFFTFWNNETLDNEIYDNKENSYIWDFDVNFYSSNPNLVNTKLLEAKKILKQYGFIINGKGYDITSDKQSHTGRGMNVLKIEK